MYMHHVCYITVCHCKGTACVYVPGRASGLQLYIMGTPITNGMSSRACWHVCRSGLMFALVFAACLLW